MPSQEPATVQSCDQSGRPDPTDAMLVSTMDYSLSHVVLEKRVTASGSLPTTPASSRSAPPLTRSRSETMQLIVSIPLQRSSINHQLHHPAQTKLVLDVAPSFTIASLASLLRRCTGLPLPTISLVANRRILPEFDSLRTLSDYGICDLTLITLSVGLCGGGATASRFSSALSYVVPGSRVEQVAPPAPDPPPIVPNPLAVNVPTPPPHVHRPPLPVASVIRLDGDAFTYIGKPASLGIKPGTAPSAGVFVRDGKRYYGKGAVTDDRLYALREALQEMLGNGMYRHFGCHAQQLILSEQQWLPGSEMFTNDISASSGVHLMSEWIDGFTPFGPFVAQQLLCAVWPPPSDVFVVGRRGALPVRGLGQIIAVSMLLNDTDCIGGTGGNVGYTIVTDEDTNAPLFANSIKIDPGQSFRMSRKDDSQSKSRYNALLTSSLDAVTRGRAHVNPQHTFDVKSLPLWTASEFTVCTASIGSHSIYDIRELLCCPGMEPLMSSQDALPQLVVSFLATRQSALTAASQGSEPTVTSTFQALSAMELLEDIKSGYVSKSVLVDPVTGAKHPIDERFVNARLLEKVENDTKQRSVVEGSPKPQSNEPQSPMDDNGGRATLLNSFEAIRAKKTHISVEDMFIRCNGSTRRVNMSGGAGIGKSTCCQSIVSRWAAGQLFNEFSLVVLVPLRRLTSGRYPSGDRYTVFDVIIQECLDLHPSPRLRECIKELYDPQQTLWILDGYDEIVGRLPDQLAIAFDEMTSAPNRILTGRPHAMNGLRDVLAGDVDVEVAGLSDANIEEYVDKFALQANMTPDLLMNHLRRVRLVWDLAHIPVNLALLCHVFAEFASESAETSLTELYCRVELLMGRRYCAKSGVDVTVLTSKQQDAIVNPVFDFLHDIAFQAMKDGVVLIPGVAISSRGSTSRLSDGDVWPALLASGLLVQVDGDVESRMASNYHFLHLTLQEFFAAKRITAALCGDLPLPDVDVQWLRTHKYDLHLEVMWWFVGGLVGRCAHFGRCVGLTALAALWCGSARDIGRLFEAGVWLCMIEEGRLWRLESESRPTIVDDVLSLAKQYATDRFLQSLPDPIQQSLELCPLLCREAILAGSRVISLANDDCKHTMRRLGKAVLHCDWLWGLLEDHFEDFDWRCLMPEFIGAVGVPVPPIGVSNGPLGSNGAVVLEPLRVCKEKCIMFAKFEENVSIGDAKWEN